MESTVCRLCLAADAAVNIFGKGKTTVLDMIQVCCPISVSESDGLPHKVCSQCVDTLKICHKFRRQCVDSDKVLKEEHALSLSERIVKVEQIDDEFVKYELDEDNISDGQYEDDDKESYVVPLMNLVMTQNDSKSLKEEEDKPAEIIDNIIVENGITKTKRSNRNKKQNSSKINNNNSKHIKKVKTKIKDASQLFKEEIIVKKERISHDKMLQIRREQQSQKVVCALCGKSIKRTNMKDHMRVHSSERAFGCEICFKKFKVRGNLHKHIKNMHRDTTVVCDICKKSYSNRCYLKVHISMVHATGLNHPCDICDRKFKDKRLLILHRRTHTQERPYQCRFCDSKFTLSSSRLDHERLHTGVTPYQCPCCPKAFVQLSNMKSHFRHNHKEIVFSEVYKGRPRSKKILIDDNINTVLPSVINNDLSPYTTNNV